MKRDHDATQDGDATSTRPVDAEDEKNRKRARGDLMWYRLNEMSCPLTPTAVLGFDAWLARCGLVVAHQEASDVMCKCRYYIPDLDDRELTNAPCLNCTSWCPRCNERKYDRDLKWDLEMDHPAGPQRRRIWPGLCGRCADGNGREGWNANKDAVYSEDVSQEEEEEPAPIPTPPADDERAN